MTTSRVSMHTLSRRSLPAAVAVLLTACLGAPPSTARAQSVELFFSEYVEGTANNKALEVFNGTGALVDLAAGAYNVQVYFNGSRTAGLTINLTGTVTAGGGSPITATAL